LLITFNAGTNGIIQATGDAEDPTAQFLVDHLGNNGNTLEDPELGGISRITDGGFDPRPTMDGPAYTGTIATPPSDDFFDQTSFKGAFCNEGVWIKDWTAVSEYGILGSSIPLSGNACDAISDVDDLFVENNGFILAQSTPNPTSGLTAFSFLLPQTATVELVVFDRDGKAVANVMSATRMNAGDHVVAHDLSNLANGVYFYTLRSGEVTITKSLVVIK